MDKKQESTQRLEELIASIANRPLDHKEFVAGYRRHHICNDLLPFTDKEKSVWLERWDAAFSARFDQNIAALDRLKNGATCFIK